MQSVAQSVLVGGVNGILIHLIGSILVRWCVSFGSYSGEDKPPMFGDYEAQRHWQEITFNLPVESWYMNSSFNDMMYWGLDYPPLTAYHSWVCGFIADQINPQWVQIETSRGTESYKHKIFMRYTVLVADLLVLFPALIFMWYLHKHAHKRPESQSNVIPSPLLLTFFYPGLILIDHGHFQYNNISLGLMIWSVLAFGQDWYIAGAISFCLSLNYKQMELYHSLPIFFFLLGKAFSKSWLQCAWMISKLGATVILTFIVLWLPFLSSPDSVLTVFHRLFPVNRGLYEDKVANFWCSISPVIKFKQLMEQQSILKLCAVTTLLLSLPSCFHLMKNPKIKNLKFALVNVALIFFLFSYQVHEKSILIAAIPACLLYNIAPPILITLFLHFTVLSMSPLLFKDHLTMQQIVTSFIFLTLASIYHGCGNKAFLSVTKLLPGWKPNTKIWIRNMLSAMFWLCIVLSGLLITLPFVYTPPDRFPDIIPVIISTVSCAAFLFFTLLFHYLQFKSETVVTKKEN